jgi:hypothetical protein
MCRALGRTILQKAVTEENKFKTYKSTPKWTIMKSHVILPVEQGSINSHKAEH